MKKKAKTKGSKETPVKKVSSLFSDKTKVINIDLGCGENKQAGFIGVDLRDANGVDIVQDLEKYPWKDIPDNVADLVFASHLLEHINPAGGGFIKFMDEIWRITKFGGRLIASFPYAGSPGYWQDPTHVNGITEVTIAYFDPLAKDLQSGTFYHLYTIYRPKPWKIVSCNYNIYGNMEILLEKRIVDKSYNVSEEYTKPTKSKK